MHKFISNYVKNTVVASLILPAGTLITDETNGKIYVHDGTTAGGFQNFGDVSTVFGRTGAITLLSADVTTALGFTPANKAGDTITGVVTLSAAGTALTVTNNALVSGVLTLGSYLATATAANVSAAGTTQATATPLTSQTNVVKTVATGSGVIISSTLNSSISVLNRGANALLVYPPVSAQFEALGLNVAISIAVGATARFIMVSSILGYSH